ncbi:MAG: hypothetical protein ACRECQ_17630 [Burkholderiaceae bacterium]
MTGVLLLLAAALLVALYFYGKRQIRNSLPPEESSDEQAAPKPIARSGRHAPTRIEPTISHIGTSQEPAVLPAEPESTEESAPASVGGWMEDPLLDVVLELRCAHSFDGVAALEARAQLDRLALPLPTHLAVWDTKVARWSAPDRFGFYSEMLIAVQLATRRHALGEIDAARFVAAVQQIALSIDADFDPPDAARIVAQAAELDRLCARFDAQITLTLEASGVTWSDAEIDTAARDAGFGQVRPGFWRRPPIEGAPLSMTAPSNSRLAMTLDVPLAPIDPPPLPMLFDAAQNIAQRLDARVVDDNGRTVEADAQVAISTELQSLAAEMHAAKVEPGSPRARRLYVD